MRIVVTSDTHHNFHALATVAKRHNNADLFLHLGDGANELMQVADMSPNHVFKNVLGNCDFSIWPGSKREDCISCGIAKIFYTHGHLYQVKNSLELVFQAGVRAGANVILFGHTHIPYVTFRDGVHLMNPGSLGQPRGSKPSYGIVDVTDTDIVCYTTTL